MSVLTKFVPPAAARINKIIVFGQLIEMRKIIQINNMGVLDKSTTKFSKDIHEISKKKDRLLDILNTQNISDIKPVLNAIKQEITIESLFISKLDSYAQSLINESVNIYELLDQKQELIKKILEPNIELSVIISHDLKEYFPMIKKIEEIPFDNSEKQKTLENTMRNLTSFVRLACQEIDDITKKNIDLLTSIRLNYKLSRWASKIIEEENTYFYKIKNGLNDFFKTVSSIDQNVNEALSLLN